MENQSPQNKPSQFISNLVTAIRKISIYPAKHPIVVESITNVYAVISEIFSGKEALSLSLSQDNKVLIDGEPLNDKNPGLAKDILPYLKKIDIENMTFQRGITEQEVEDFLQLLLLDAAQLKGLGDINKIFADKNIQHIKADQYSYIKINKDKEALLGAELNAWNALKDKIKELSSGKAVKSQDVGGIEKELFTMMSAEFKEKNKISPATKSLFKKFISVASRDKTDTLQVLKEALIGYGCPSKEVEALVNKIQDEIARPVKKGRGPAAGGGGGAGEGSGGGPGTGSATGTGESESLKKENEELRVKLRRIQEERDRFNLELEQVKKHSKVVQSEKDRIDNIIHHMADGLVVVDPQGKILLMNPQAETMLGVNHQYSGTPIKDLVKDDHLLTVVKDIPTAKDEVMQKDIELVGSNETTKKILRTSSAVVEDSFGKTVGMVTILNDVTKQKELDQIKSNFVANVSHELRTPLVAIQKSISLILEKTAGEISEPQEQFLSIAERNLKRLSLLINDLLDLSKLEAGQMRIKRSLCRIDKVIGDSTESLNIWAKTKAIEIRKSVQEGLPEINIDANRIIQVLNNLIGNSIKFTPQNGLITVEAKASPEKQECYVLVKDNGIGIEEQNLKKVFDKFYQIGEKSTADVGGTGIGLAVAKEIVELHGGKIRVESKRGEGTVFTFTLPFSGMPMMEVTDGK
ncbi:MAG: ATP-binding protein [Candidatus Omnitrophota bacterium]